MPLKLHKFGEAWGLADPSPFCLKLESFLREANIAYDVVPFDARRSFGKAPKGKLPFIEDEDGELVGDSTLIIERLSRQHRVDLDAPLDDRQRCVSLAFRRMLDEHLYWVGVYSRWIDEPGWSVVPATLFAQCLAAVPAGHRRVRAPQRDPGAARPGHRTSCPGGDLRARTRRHGGVERAARRRQLLLCRRPPNPARPVVARLRRRDHRTADRTRR